MTQKEIADYFGKTGATILNWEKHGCPAHRTAGTHPLYDLDEVLAWRDGKQKKRERAVK